MSQIELCDLSKTYDKKTMVLENISLEVEQGEFMILVGPSGCGKSTLLRMIAGLESISDGILKIGGEIANAMKPKDRHISMVFQNYALYPHMTVRDNILFGLDIQGVSRMEQDKRLKETADMVGLTDFLDRKPGQLSGGQRQRVALARSICSRAPICLMDEPLSNLDAKLRGQMRTEIRRIQKALGLTVLYVTHDQVEAMTMGDRIMVLNAGKIQQIGTPLALYNHPANRFVASFIGSPQMNIAPARIEGNRLIINEIAVILLDSTQKSQFPDGSFDIGIRAEHIRYSERKTETSCKVHIQNVEMMGNETQVVFAIGTLSFTARWQGQWAFTIGMHIWVEIPPEHLYCFDKEHGQLILAPSTESASTIPVKEAVS